MKINDRSKNLAIIMLVLIILILAYSLFIQSYGKYCQPVIREKAYGPE